MYMCSKYSCTCSTGYKHVRVRVVQDISMYSRGHKKVNVSYSFYDRSLVRSVFTIKNRFYDCKKQLKPLTQSLRMRISIRNQYGRRC